jgi:hypothetical protein
MTTTTGPEHGGCCRRSRETSVHRRRCRPWRNRQSAFPMCRPPASASRRGNACGI